MKQHFVIFKPLILLFILLFILSCIPFDTLKSDAGIKITQAVLYAVVQRRTEDGSYELSQIFLFPVSLNTIENLHKKAFKSPPTS